MRIQFEPSDVMCDGESLKRRADSKARLRTVKLGTP